MKTVIFAVSKKGLQTAKGISEALTGIYGEEKIDIQVCIKSKFADSHESDKTGCQNLKLYFLNDNEEMSECAHSAFDKADALIFVCACGIAVRMIAPCVNDKALDPAVLVIDEGLSFCIPILSGHLGGANELACKLSDALGITPVITTASDGRGLKAVDLFAMENRLTINDLKKAGEYTAALLNGEKLYVRNETGMRRILGELPDGYEHSAGKETRLIRIAYGYPEKDTDALTLVPKCLRVGIGCRRGISRGRIAEAVDNCFAKHGLYREAVAEVTSIDLKADEEGLLDYCNDAGLPITFYSADRLKKVEGDLESSDFVNEVTGVDNVCERSALVKGGHLLVRKEKYEGVTVAVAVCENE